MALDTGAAMAAQPITSDATLDDVELARRIGAAVVNDHDVVNEARHGANHAANMGLLLKGRDDDSDAAT